MKTIIERFSSKIKINKTTGCHEWQAGKSANGYGRFYINGKTQYAHRVVWLLVHGFIPEDIYILHNCDNPCCVNIDHLKQGDHQENMDDKVARNRQSRFALVGIASCVAKLSEQDVNQIRLSTESHRQLAKKFKIGKSQIGRIKRFQQWQHIK